MSDNNAHSSDADDLMLIMPFFHSASQDRLCQAVSAIMQYSNLTNEEVSEEKIDVGEENVEVRTGVNKPQDILVKKEAYWFLAMVLTFIMIGSVVFYVTHTGGYMFIYHNYAT